MTFRRHLWLIFTLVVVSNSFICTEERYEDFLNHWGRNLTEQKKYPDYSTRLNNYCENRRFVEKTNSQNLSYTLDIYWRKMDQSEEERNRILKKGFGAKGVRATAASLSDIESLRKVSSSLPPYVDYRQSGDISSIKNQGQCGCCWSFAIVGTYESWMMLKGEQEYDLSEQYLLECTTKFTKKVLKENYESSCDGGYPDFSGQLAKVTGIPLQTNYPYISENYYGTLYPETPGICDTNQTIAYGGNPQLTTFTVFQNVTKNTMKELIARGPVSASLYVNSGFDAYSSGVYTGCPASFATSYENLNHVLVVIGYDVDGNYIVKNSWGQSWGMNGFGVISKDNDCGITAQVMQYVSQAPPGNGVVYQKPANLGSEYLVFTILLLLSLMLMIN